MGGKGVTPPATASPPIEAGTGPSRKGGDGKRGKRGGVHLPRNGQPANRGRSRAERRELRRRDFGRAGEVGAQADLHRGLVRARRDHARVHVKSLCYIIIL